MDMHSKLIFCFLVIDEYVNKVSRGMNTVFFAAILPARIAQSRDMNTVFFPPSCWCAMRTIFVYIFIYTSRRAREFYFEFIIQKKVYIRKKVHSDILSEYKK